MSKQQQNFECRFCNRVYGDRFNLNKHISQCEARALEASQNIPQKQVEAERKTMEGTHKEDNPQDPVLVSSKNVSITEIPRKYLLKQVFSLLSKPKSLIYIGGCLLFLKHLRAKRSQRQEVINSQKVGSLISSKKRKRKPWSRASIPTKSRQSTLTKSVSRRQQEANRKALEAEWKNPGSSMAVAKEILREMEAANRKQQPWVWHSSPKNTLKLCGGMLVAFLIYVYLK